MSESDPKPVPVTKKILTVLKTENVPLDHQQLKQKTGASTEALSNALNRLKKRGQVGESRSVRGMWYSTDENEDKS